MVAIPFLEFGTSVQGERAWENGYMDIFAESDHGGSHQRHDVFAANEPAQTSDVGLEYAQIAGVALARATPAMPAYSRPVVERLGGSFAANTS